MSTYSYDEDDLPDDGPGGGSHVPGVPDRRQRPAGFSRHPRRRAMDNGIVGRLSAWKDHYSALLSLLAIVIGLTGAIAAFRELQHNQEALLRTMAQTVRLDSAQNARLDSIVNVLQRDAFVEQITAYRACIMIDRDPSVRTPKDCAAIIGAVESGNR